MELGGSWTDLWGIFGGFGGVYPIADTLESHNSPSKVCMVDFTYSLGLGFRVDAFNALSRQTCANSLKEFMRPKRR